MIAILDIGKTNKKALVFNSDYEVIFETSVVLNETQDEDGDPCEDIKALTQWVLHTIHDLIQDTRFNIRAINFSAYGASFVLLDSAGKPVAPLYNYLKPLDSDFVHQFCEPYGGEKQLAVQTSSPVLGNLNSGIQLYRLKKLKPEIFQSVHLALHLPQYLSYLFTHLPCSDLTSIGCHTLLWDFNKQDYHPWVYRESIDKVLAPVMPSSESLKVEFGGREISCGIGLHDSSAALIPYLASINDPFILLSTGTWCIALNPFNEQELKPEELDQDCLCYISFQGKPVKASRLFAGHEHEQQVLRIASHYAVPEDFYQNLSFDPFIDQGILKQKVEPVINPAGLKQSGFENRMLDRFNRAEDAYYVLISDLIVIQVASLNLVQGYKPVKTIFVDGGFSKNKLYMQMLANALEGYQVFAASLAQASALGAARAIQYSWNEKAILNQFIQVIPYQPQA
jgi:L-fuculokinase